MRESTWKCDLCRERVTEAHRIKFISVGKLLEGTAEVRSKSIQLCPLDDNSASETVVCISCRKLLAEATEAHRIKFISVGKLLGEAQVKGDK